MKKNMLRFILFTAIPMLTLTSCKKSDNSGSGGSQSDVASMISETNGWHIEKKSEVAEAFN
jgi:hypothetical protein